MRRLIAYTMLIVLSTTLLSGCITNAEDEISETQKQFDELRMEDINKLANTNYDNLDEALKKSIRKFKKSDSSDDLFVICQIITSERYEKYITTYYKELFDRIIEDEEFAERMGVVTFDGIYYLKQLRKEGETQRYKEFYESLDIFFDPNRDMFSVLLWFSKNAEVLSYEEKEYHVEVILSYLERYKDTVHVMFIGGAYYTLTDLYWSLGEYDLSDKYRKLHEEKEEEFWDQAQEKKNE